MSAQTEGDSASNQSSRAERELVVVWVSPGSLATAFALCCAPFGLFSSISYFSELRDQENLAQIWTTSVSQNVSVLATDMFLRVGIGLVIGWVTGSVLAAVFNSVMYRTGGVRLRVREVDLAMSKSPRRHAWAFKLGRFFGKFLAKKE